MHTQTNETVTIGGYTRPLITNVMENLVNEQGYAVPTPRLKFGTNFIINNIDNHTQGLNQLLTGVLALIATHPSLHALMGNIASTESPDIAGVETLVNPSVKNENPLASLRPDELSERLGRILTDKQTISVEVSLCTLPELYYLLNDVHRGVPEAVESFMEICKLTFGVKPPPNFPIFVRERIEFPVGVIPTDIQTPLTSLSPSRLFVETNDEVAALKLMNAELGISGPDTTPFDEYMLVLSDLVGDATVYERGLRYQFTTEFLQYIVNATVGLNIEAHNKYLVQPTIELGMDTFAINNSISLSELTAGRTFGASNGLAHQDVTAHAIFQPRY